MQPFKSVCLLPPLLYFFSIFILSFSSGFVACGSDAVDYEIFDDMDVDSLQSEDPLLHAALSSDMPAVVELRFFYSATPTTQTRPDSYCGGLSLSAHWIITAAHCIDSFVSRDGVRALRRLEVRHTLASGTKITTYPRGQAAYYLHPDYDSTPHLLSGQQNDFALIRLYGNGQSVAVNALLYFDAYQPWNNSFVGQVFTMISYGPGTDPANNRDYDCNRPYGTKRAAQFWLDRTRSPGNSSTRLVGAFDNSDDFSGQPKLCPGDSGSTWAFTFHGPAAFAITSGWYDPFWILGENRWVGVLIRPKLDWILATARAKGLPLSCSRIVDHRNNNQKEYRQCRESLQSAAPGGQEVPGFML